MTPDIARLFHGRTHSGRSGPGAVVRSKRCALTVGILLCGLLQTHPAVAQNSGSPSCGAHDSSNCTPADDTAPAALPASYELDWVPTEAVPEESRDHQCLNCGGSYIDPLADADSQSKPADSDIEAHTDSTQLQGDTILLRGGVKAVQGYRHLQADQVAVDRKAETAELTGHVMVREPGVLLTGESAQLNATTDEAAMQNGVFVLHAEHLRGSAQLLQRNTDGLIHIEDGKFTYCAPGNEDWAIEANQLDLDTTEGIGTARGAKLRLGGLPVLYTPWLRFPLDDRRRTGFLWPNIGSDSDGGLDLAAPIYFNLAPNYDALFIPRYIQERGMNNELTLRYLGPLTGNWLVGGAYMGDDRRYQDQAPKQNSHDRWLGVINQSGLYRQRWRSRIDYSKASDGDYLKDLETSSLDAQRRTSLLQLASMDYLGDDWLVNLDFQQFQSLADDISDDYQKLPQLTGQYRGAGNFLGLQPILLAQYSNFDTDDRDRVTGQRVYGEVGVAYPLRSRYGFLTSKIKYRTLDYKLTNNTSFSDDSPTARSALASIDGGLFFDRSTQIGGRHLQQTLEPRLYYLYSQYEDQTDQPDFDSSELTFSYNQLFRETRFSGRDRLDDANQLAVGISTRFLDDSDGQQLFRASIGQIFYLRDRKVRLLSDSPPLNTSSSEIAADISFNPSDNLTLFSNLVWDPHSKQANSALLQATYKPDDRSVYNIGYSYRRPQTLVSNQSVTKEASVSAYVPVNRQWSVFGALNYSLEVDKSVEDMFGVEYDSCCWKVRLMHLRYYDNISGQVPDFNNPNLERQSSTQIQIVLKGMGGFNDRISNTLRDMIRGFNERED